MYQAGLVLEGGGMKGVYTSGVLDYFLDQSISFSSCYGVSAGAGSLCSYLSGQKGRAYRVMADYLEDKRYCSFYSLLTTGDMFGAKMCYETIPRELDPFDYDTYRKHLGNFYCVVTNIETGEPEYKLIKDLDTEMEAIRASSSLPLLSRNVNLDGKWYLDGGIADPIPIRKSILDGNKKNVVIMTKEVGYRRKQASMLGLMKLYYRKYPHIYRLMKIRHTDYNHTLDYMEEQILEGHIFMIRPQEPSGVGRIEKDKGKLQLLYEQGYEDGARNYAAMINYLEK